MKTEREIRYEEIIDNLIETIDINNSLPWYKRIFNYTPLAITKFYFGVLKDEN